MNPKDRQVTTDTTRRTVHCVEREALPRAGSGVGKSGMGGSKSAECSSVTQAKHASNPIALRVEEPASSTGASGGMSEWRQLCQLSWTMSRTEQKKVGEALLGGFYQL